LLNNSCPGITPCINNPPSNTAAVTLPGIPNVNRGINDPPVTALFAHSGAATPSIIPVPYLSDCLEKRLDSLYAIQDAISPPAPGKIPTNTPTIPEIRYVFPSVSNSFILTKRALVSFVIFTVT